MEKLTCPPQELVLFCRQLQVMMASGVPIYQALEVLKEREDQPGFSRAVDTLAQKIGQGHRLSRALRLFPRVFDMVFASLVAVGEETGQLDKCLERLARWKERDLEIRRKIVSALTYPALVLLLTAAMTFFLFTFILPGFIEVFANMGAELPLPTKVLITLTNMVASPVFWLLAIVLGVFSTQAFTRYARSDRGSVELTLLLLTVPLLGPMVLNASIARFAASVATMLDSGMDLTRALALGAQATGNPAIRQDSNRVLQDIRMGALTSLTLSVRPDLYPNNLIQMVSVGEEASDMAEMFKRAAEFHEEEANHLVDTLGAALEPLLLAGVAFLLGFVLISVFLPLYSHLDKL